MHRNILLAALILSATISFTVVDSRAAAPNSGFIYGTVTTFSGKEMTGFLRWDVEEAFWDDLFHSYREELPWFDYVDPDELKREKSRAKNHDGSLFKRFVWALTNETIKNRPGRIFICRFGDIKQLKMTDQNSAQVVMRDLSTHNVSGYANDVGGTIIIYQAGKPEKELDWDHIDSIEFSAAPEELAPYAERLYGLVETSRGDFEGFVQWDKSECTSLDMLDGRTKNQSLEIPMGDIKFIERQNSKSCNVALKNGETVRLHGTNDVNGDNRGIMIEVAELGRVTVPWKRFRKATFIDGKGSGFGYDSFAEQSRLNAVVKDSAGNSHEGLLVFDLDEAYSWDIFNGRRGGLEYDIPFKLIHRITRNEPDRVKVALRSGMEQILGDAQDACDKNSGLLIFENPDSENPDYLSWYNVATVAFRN